MIGARAAAGFLACGIASGLALVACSDGDPCDGAATCLRIDIDSLTVERIDELQLDVVYGDLHSTTSPTAGESSQLPLSTAIILDLPSLSTVRVDVVAAGIVADTALGTGAASRMISEGEHAVLPIRLAPVENCT